MDHLKRSRSETPSTVATIPPKRARPSGLLDWIRDKFGQGDSSSTQSESRPPSANSVRSIPLSSDTEPEASERGVYGGRSNPIDVDEDYEAEEVVYRPVAGPSRARRPNLDGQGLWNDYSGLVTDNPANTPVRVTVSSTRRDTAMRRFRIRSRQYGGGRRAERGLQEGRRAEAEIARQGAWPSLPPSQTPAHVQVQRRHCSSCADGSATFSWYVISSTKGLTTARRWADPQPKAFKKLEPYKTPKDLEEQLERFAIHVQEDEERVQEALKSRIPESLTPEQMAIVRPLVRPVLMTGESDTSQWQLQKGHWRQGRSHGGVYPPSQAQYLAR